MYGPPKQSAYALMAIYLSRNEHRVRSHASDESKRFQDLWWSTIILACKSFLPFLY